MSDDAKCYAATPAETLEQHITDSSVAKNEAEWWAYHEITRLREENARLRGLLVEAQDYIDDVYDPLYISIGQELESLKRAAAIREGNRNE